MAHRKIFDEYGNEIDVASVIYDFIMNKAKEHNVDADDVSVGYWMGTSGASYISVNQLCDNGYDGLETHSLGDDIEV